MAECEERVPLLRLVEAVTWELSHRCDPLARPIADRHYNRQSVGAANFVPPGRCIVLVTPDAGALWVSSWPYAEYVRHDWKGAWVNSTFRRESGPVASELIREALAVTRHFWEPPSFPCPHCGRDVSMVSFIDGSKVRRKRDLGRCYIRAGFVRCTATTKGGLAVVHIGKADMPASLAPGGFGGQLPLIAA